MDLLPLARESNRIRRRELETASTPRKAERPAEKLDTIDVIARYRFGYPAWRKALSYCDD